MSKKIFLNFILLLVTYIGPLYFLYVSQGDILKMEKIQVPLLIVLFIGSALMTYINNKCRKEVLNYKWFWIGFEIIGVLGLAYSAFILSLLFSFRKGIDF